MLIRFYGYLVFGGLLASVLFLLGGWYFYPPIAASIILGCCVYTSNQIASGVGYHRRFSHASFKTLPAVDCVLLLMGATALQGPVIGWVGIHLRHHQVADTAHDPHSPRNYTGRFRNHLWDEIQALCVAAFGGWTMSVPTDIERYAKHLRRKRHVKFFNALYFPILLAWLFTPATIAYFLAGGDISVALNILIWGTAIPMGLSVFVTLVMNALGHTHEMKLSFGEQEISSSRTASSTNIWWFAPFVLGEHLHNRHHERPWSAQNGLKLSDLDISYWIICLLKTVHLAWDVKRYESS